jgi:NADPH:quinone reductase-like Zn-dependent oxidoreductase
VLAVEGSAAAFAGQTLLVLGAGGGVGVAAVQIGKVLGAKVIAVARGAAKAEVLKQLGVDAVIDTSGMTQPHQQSAQHGGPGKVGKPKGKQDGRQQQAQQSNRYQMSLLCSIGQCRCTHRWYMRWLFLLDLC